MLSQNIWAVVLPTCLRIWSNSCAWYMFESSSNQRISLGDCYCAQILCATRQITMLHTIHSYLLAKMLYFAREWHLLHLGEIYTCTSWRKKHTSQLFEELRPLFSCNPPSLPAFFPPEVNSRCLESVCSFGDPESYRWPKNVFHVFARRSLGTNDFTQLIMVNPN